MNHRIIDSRFSVTKQYYESCQFLQVFFSITHVSHRFSEKSLGLSVKAQSKGVNPKIVAEALSPVRRIQTEEMELLENVVLQTYFFLTKKQKLFTSHTL